MVPLDVESVVRSIGHLRRGDLAVDTGSGGHRGGDIGLPPLDSVGSVTTDSYSLVAT